MIEDIAVDIKPQGCPNPLQVKAEGVLPVAILGSSTFDVTTVDPTSIKLEGKLEGVSAIRWATEDVGTPFVPYIGKTLATDCNSLKRDGFLDLVLTFDNQEVVKALESVQDRDVVVLHLYGKLKPEYGSIPIRGEDVVVIVGRK